MPTGRPYGPNDPSLLASLETAVRRVRRPGPAELAWSWRWEFTLLALIAGPAALIASKAGLPGLTVAAGAGLAASAAVLLCWPPARRWVIARAWCLVTPHRVRAGCVNAWVQTRSGRLPMIVSTTPADYGEQVRLWLRAGLTAADLQAASPVLAAACWAAEVRVVPGVRHAHLVTLQVIRRQPERVWPALDDSPAPRRVVGDGLGGTGEARRWPGQVVPPPRLSPRQDWAESGGRSNALVPSDDGY